jgi:hypothetical protein
MAPCSSSSLEVEECNLRRFLSQKKRETAAEGVVVNAMHIEDVVVDQAEQIKWWDAHDKMTWWQGKRSFRRGWSWRASASILTRDGWFRSSRAAWL